MTAKFNAKQAIDSYYAKRRPKAALIEEPTCTAAKLHFRAAQRMNEAEQATESIAARAWRWLRRRLTNG